MAGQTKPINVTPPNPAGMRCGNCIGYNPKAEGIGECRMNPPQVILIPSQNAIGQMQVTPAATFPATPETSWCAAYDDANSEGEQASPLVLNP